MDPNRPEWLPEIVNVNGEWEEVLRRLYQIFDQDFRKSGCVFEKRQIFWDKRVLEGRYEEGFWHLITKADEQTGERLLEPRRAERLPWCKPTLTNSKDSAVKVWDYPEGKVRTYVWLEDWDYVIVLEKRKHRIGEIVFLITAFFVDGESSRRNLRRKYKARRP